VIQDEIANMFLRNGIYVTQAIASILAGTGAVKDHPDLREAIQALGRKVASLAAFGQRATDIGQAVIDLFHEADSDAFAWLARLSTVYISLCSLGLDRRSQAQMEERLRELDILLDTDIVLSLLSPGEPQHEAVEAIVKGWQRINGRVFVSPCVLEESAYHAWISDRDYQETWRILSTMDDNEALRLIQNTFVRGFRMEAKGKYHPTAWGYYIGMFRGASEYDSTKIGHLLHDQGVLPVTEEGADSGFAGEVASAVLHADREEHSEDPPEANREVADKCSRDGRLMAVLMKHRQERAKLGGAAVVVSSSRRLRVACARFKDRLGQPEPVVPVGAIAYFLAMMPGTNLSLASLKGVLFDTGFATRLQGLERIALRILHASEQYFFPFARRGSLRVQMREKVKQIASQHGESPKNVEIGIIHGNLQMKEDIATVVAEAVDQLISSRSERKIQNLEKKLRELRRG